MAPSLSQTQRCRHNYYITLDTYVWFFLPPPSSLPDSAWNVWPGGASSRVAVDPVRCWHPIEHDCPQIISTPKFTRLPLSARSRRMEASWKTVKQGSQSGGVASMANILWMCSTQRFHHSARLVFWTTIFARMKYHHRWGNRRGKVCLFACLLVVFCLFACLFVFRFVLFCFVLLCLFVVFMVVNGRKKTYISMKIPSCLHFWLKNIMLQDIVLLYTILHTCYRLKVLKTIDTERKGEL